MKNKLDYFFKRKLQDRQFDFNESYWNEMEQLLPQKKRTHKGYWSWLGLAVLLIGILGVIWILPQGNSPKPNASNPNNEHSPAINTSTEERTSSSFNSNQNSKARLPNVDEQRGKNNHQPQNSHNINLNNQDYTTKQLSNIDKQREVSNIRPTNSQNIDRNNEDYINLTTKQLPNSDKRNRSNAQPTKYLTTTKSILREVSYTTRQLNRIEMDKIKGSTPFPSISTTQPMVLRHWQYGIITERQIESYAPKWRTGATIHYQIFPFLSLASEIKYTYQAGSFHEVLMHSDSVFSFGFIQEDISIQPKSLHFVEVPIYASLDLGRQSIIGGLELQKILGVKGNIATYHTTQLQPNNKALHHSKTGWLPKDSFSTVNTYFLLGYEYRFGRVAVGLRGHYHLNKLSIRAKQTERFVTNPKKSSWSITLSLPLSEKTKPFKN